MSHEERRKSPRFAVDIPVRLTAGDGSWPAHLRDICRDAALVECDRECPLDTAVSIAMELPGTGGPLVVAGRVVRQAAGEKAPHSMAVLFTEISQAASARIDFFVALKS